MTMALMPLASRYFQSPSFIFNGWSFLTNKAKINKANNQSVSKLNTKPVLIEQNLVEKKIESHFCDNIAQEIYKLFLVGWSFLTGNTTSVPLCCFLQQDISISKQISWLNIRVC